MPRPSLPWDERVKAKREWAAFVRGILERTCWTEQQLGEAVGVSVPAISRWIDDDPKTGRLPSSPAQRMLIDIARSLNLISEDPDPSSDSGSSSSEDPPAQGS